MSNPLQENLNKIKFQKDIYLQPQFIAKGITIYGVTGEYIGNTLTLEGNVTSNILTTEGQVENNVLEV